MASTAASNARRGSGYSIALNNPNTLPNTKVMTAAPPGMFYPPPTTAPIFIQSPTYPLLMNPPNMPTYSYGIPPMPLAMHGYPDVGQQEMMAQMPAMRRAGSINAKLMAQDAKRPFGTNIDRNVSEPALSEATYMNVDQPRERGYELEAPKIDPAFDTGTIEDEERRQRLMKEAQVAQVQRTQSFMDKLKFWNSNKVDEEAPNRGETTLPRSVSVTKRDYHENNGTDNHNAPGPYIEEMMDSVSVANNNVEDNQFLNERQPSEHLSVLGPEQFSASVDGRVAPVRWKHSRPYNTVVMFVPQQEAWVVERMGKFNRILEPGVNVLVPVLDRVKYVQSLKEIAIDVPKQGAITLDNVTLNIDGVLYLRIVDAYKASYGVEEPEFAITQLAQTTMRSEIGKITLDTLFRERENLNQAIVMAINQASDAWGISCMRYEIRDVRMHARVQEAMQMQVEAERKKRAAVLESEGIKMAEINVAEGKKQSRILQSEAEKQELINAAQGAAEAVVAAGKARAESIRLVADSLEHRNGANAAGLAVAEKYVAAFQELARTNNTLILPANTNDVTSMVAQAMSIYQRLQPPGSVEGLPESSVSLKDAKTNPSVAQSVTQASTVVNAEKETT